MNAFYPQNIFKGLFKKYLFRFLIRDVMLFKILANVSFIPLKSNNFGQTLNHKSVYCRNIQMSSVEAKYY